MNSVTLTYTDRQNFVHTLKVLRRDPQQDFYQFLSVNGNKRLLIHAPLVTVTHGDQSTHGDTDLFEHLLEQQGDKLQDVIQWHTWRQQGPVLGRWIVLKNRADSRKEECPHSAAELDSLMQRGWTEWRYV